MIENGQKVSFQSKGFNHFMDGKVGTVQDIFTNQSGERVGTFVIPNRSGQPGYGARVLVSELRPA